jgi:hypothetical protein
MACIKSGKSLFVALVVGAWLAAAGLVYAQDQTLEGTLSNTHCGLKHSTPNASGAACVNGCVNSQNAKYALVVGDKVYTLEGGDNAQYQKLAGLAAKVTGHVDGMTIHVSSVSAGAAGSGSGCMM